MQHGKQRAGKQLLQIVNLTFIYKFDDEIDDEEDDKDDAEMIVVKTFNIDNSVT